MRPSYLPPGLPEGRAGWRAQPAVRIADPLPELLREVERTRADLLVIRARGVGGVERLLLGRTRVGWAPVRALY